MHALNDIVAKDGFRLRGTSMSRLDAFSDVVFGFALTLLVVSLEVPKTFAELRESLMGFLPFAICFLFLMMLWWAHFRFFRRYGLHDFATMVLNSLLLFLLLFYVYPLKFLFTVFSRSVFNGDNSHVFQHAGEVREMMLLYCLGYAAVYFAVAALYLNAWRLRDDLHLNQLERTLTKSYIWDFAGVASVGLLAAAVSLLLPEGQAGWAGFAFFAIGIFKTVHGFVAGHHIRRADALTPPDHRLPLASHH